MRRITVPLLVIVGMEAISTYVGLKMGATEGNLILAWIARLGSIELMVIFKTLATAGGVWILVRRRAWGLLLAVTIILGAVAAWNIANLILRIFG